MIWPAPRFVPLVTITPYSIESMGGTMATFASRAINSATSGTWLLANSVGFFPFYVSYRTTVQQLFWMNGATISGNVDVGIYTMSGTRLISTGSTAQVGANSIQNVAVSPTQLSASVYYLAFTMDNTTGTVFRYSFYNSTMIRGCGSGYATNSFPLPASVTITAGGTAIPLIALSTRTVV